MENETQSETVATQDETNLPVTDSAEETASSETLEASALKDKKRRRLKRFLVIAGAIIVVFGLIFAFLLGPIVKFGANRFGASLLGVDKYQIGSATIYPFGGYVRLEKVVIGKPQAEGVSFSHDILSVDLVEIDMDMFSLLRKKKILDRFDLQHLTVNYEQLLTGETNVDVLMENCLGVPVADAKDAGTPTQKPTKGDDEIFVGARYFVIEKIHLKTHVRGIPFSLPAISTHFRDGIGIEDDLTPNAFGVRVAGNFMSAIDAFQNSVLGDAAGAATETVSSAVGKTEDAAKAAAGATVDAVSNTAGATVDAVSDTAGAVIDFFSGSSEEPKKK